MLIVREQVPGKVSLSPKYRAVTISSSCNFHFIYFDVLRRSPSVAQVILKTMQSWLASDSEQILLPQLPSWCTCGSILLCLVFFVVVCLFACLIVFLIYNTLERCSIVKPESLL